MPPMARSIVARFQQRTAIPILFLGSLGLIAGCKTNEDAASAATQMSATAKSLSDYYAALGTVLQDTDQIHLLNDRISSKPYSAENRKQLQITQKELAARETMAADLSTLAESFAKLTKSSAPADVTAACSKLEGEVDELASYKESDVEQKAIKSALKLLVTALQGQKEHEAAEAMDSLASGLSTLFDKEAPAWKTVDEVYVRLAATLAGDLVDQNSVDYASILKPALDPFKLSPSGTTKDMQAKLAPLAKQQITDRQAALLSSYDHAEEDMSKSLQEMSKRIHLVATEKPMAFRLPPLTLTNVEKWAKEVQSE